ncbi:M14 family metallopeptidase [Algoriphagus halophytocola]|uniref:M14 family metallopeptidase n=1 Tax=Algoriphagus halophytocola TaxID=2991499 RepID=A0ABY6MD33_9BACT|nr:MULTISPECIES: M14 family metallopeptidase [unclassified Algoriphagus]UZD21438.1 M14 family metallopeptidase [Algoriphagus sp. TR-M5]WBL42650.1 M14 family metallopeptidase [Algoriphagus sp. TR-M9]
MKKLSSTLFFILSLLSLPIAAIAQDIMPPYLPWNGKSKQLIVEKSNEWVTPFELSDGLESPSYEETMIWIEKLARNSAYLEINSIGKSEQGRQIQLVIASKDQDFTAEELSTSKKPLILFQAGIHAGEIDGKDAGMMLLRDITQGSKIDLLDHANLLFIPILNVDGHERKSEYGRVNQRGPKVMGWRTNAQNLNLNRDYTKLETAGVQAIAKVINKYDPDLYIDIHVTDGADYQYDVTYGFVETGGYSPEISNWLSSHFKPEVDGALSDQGHIPGPLLFAANGEDFTEGNIAFSFSPRFSHTYGDIRHLPAILIENHSLKPFEQRVLGTYVFLEQAIKTVGKHFASLQKAIESDQNQSMESVVVKYAFRDTPADSMDFLGIASKKVTSEITGNEYVTWKGEPITQQVPSLLMDKASASVPVPKAYWIPAEWSEVIHKMEEHGIEMEVLDEAREIQLEFSKVEEFKMVSQPYEGLMRFQSFELSKSYRKVRLQPGSVRVKTKQALGELAVILLEPESVDSFFQWGYFNSILSQTEYMETYIMEPLISKMLAEDSDLNKRFEEKKASNADFAKSPRQIYRWFYEQTPYFDQNWKVIPVGREW